LSKAKVEFELEEFKNQVVVGYDIDSNLFVFEIYRGQGAHIMCKFFNFTGWMTSDLGILLTAGMTTERALAILFDWLLSVWHHSV
jgi:hypothetical protein